MFVKKITSAALKLILGKNNYLRRIGVNIGDNCQIITSEINFGSEPWLISIGSNVTITYGVKLITHDASTRIFRKEYSFLNHDFGNKFARIKIGSNVFIGVDSIILPGVSIGDHCIIGAGSVVTKNLPSRCVYAGNPAKFICTYEDFVKKNTTNYMNINAKNYKDLRKELVEKLKD